jgi:hypothetical protein
VSVCVCVCVSVSLSRHRETDRHLNETTARREMGRQHRSFMYSVGAYLDMRAAQGVDYALPTSDVLLVRIAGG